MIVSASIIISVSLTVCCLVNQNEMLESIAKTSAVYKHGVVAADQQNCSLIGVNILKENGTAVDAAIATVLCLGVVNMHSSGIGGGGVMIVHPPKTNSSVLDIDKEPIVYDYREYSPRKLASLVNDTDPSLFAMGGLSIGVPGEIAGLYAAWKDHGKLPWKRLFAPAIELARDGFHMHLRLWEAANFMKQFIIADEGLSSILLINGTVKERGTLIKNELLAATLEKIADDPMSFYTGELSSKIVEDVEKIGGVLELDDLRNYEVKKRRTINMNIDNGYTLKVAPPPFGGIIILTIFNILQGFNMSKADIQGDEVSALTFHRIVEAMKHGFAKRTSFGDPEFMNQTILDVLLKNLTNPSYGEILRNKILNVTQNESYYDPDFTPQDDHGTTHVSICAPDGSAVSITESINIWFGSGYMSNTTGIIYNNQIDDFSIKNRTNAFHLKPSPENNIQPYKRPLSSMSPVLVTKDGSLNIIAGASGGTRIITSVASFLIYKLWFEKSLNESVVDPRVHHQLTPNNLVVEKRYPIKDSVISLLTNTYKHKIGYTWIPEYSAVQAIYIDGTNIYGKSDPRKYGVEEGF